MSWYTKVAEEVPQKLVMPLPPPQAQPVQQPQQQQTPQHSQHEGQIISFINQNKNNLPTIVKNALANPTQRQIIVDLLDSLADPINSSFMQQFVNLHRSISGKKQFRNEP